jgi:acetolactate synthase-1/2/3 large subunit
VSKVTGAEIVVRALEDEGVPFTFGIPGTHNLELYDALASSSRVRPILVTDEQSASFMADAVWRSSGRLGCACLVPGAGLTHALSGIAEAFLDQIPMLVLSCGVRRDTRYGYQLHEVDQVAIAAPVTKAQLRVQHGSELHAMVRRACQIARSSTPGPVIVEVPADLYMSRHDAKVERIEALPSEELPSGAELDRAVTLLRGASRPLLHVGLGAQSAGADLVRLAERLEAPVTSTLQGKGVFPESHPLALWPGFGNAAPPFVRDIVRDRDLTLAVGCRFSEVGTGSYGIDVPQPLVHSDIDPRVLSRNYPATLGLVGDARVIVPELVRRLGEGGSRDPALRERIRRGHEHVAAEWARHRSARVSPYLLLRSVQRTFGGETIFTADSGNGLFLAAECLRLDAPGQFLAPVDYSCMGYAVPAAIGARLARPDAPVVSLVGDGAFLMTGLELITAVSEAAPIAVFVLRDGELAQIAQFQKQLLNRTASSTLGDFDVTTLGRALGVRTFRMDSDGDVASVVADAAAAVSGGRSIVVDVSIDYSKQTYFTKGVVRSNFLRLPWSERVRLTGRAMARRVR